MKKLVNYCSIIFLLLVATSQVKAQSVDVVIRENGTERKESIDLPKSMTYPLDSLLNDWKAKNYIDLGKDCSTAEINPLFSDSVYIDRLSRIPAIMEMPYNDIIRKFIDMYAGRLRNQVSFMLSACNFYMPIFEEALDAYGLPLELRYLPIIESALNPSAVSRAGASGLWQFMIGIISYNFGLGYKERVMAAERIALLTAVVCGVVATVAFTVYPYLLVGLFISLDSEAAKIAIHGFPYFASGFVFFIVNIAVVGYFQSVERIKPATIFALLRGFVFLIPSFILLPKFLDVSGIWLAMPLSEALTIIVILLFVLKHRYAYKVSN